MAVLNVYDWQVCWFANTFLQIFILNLMKMNVRQRENRINHVHKNIKKKYNTKGFQHLVDDETLVISWKSPTISQIGVPLHCSPSKNCVFVCVCALPAMLFGAECEYFSQSSRFSSALLVLFIHSPICVHLQCIIIWISFYIV